MVNLGFVDGRSRSGRRALSSCLLAATLGFPVLGLAQNDPFAQPPPGAGPSTQAGAAQAAPSTLASCEHITRELCERSNPALLASAAGYVVASVLLFSLVRAWWNRRGTSSAAARFIVPLLLASAAAGVLVALDPARGQDLRCCLLHGVFKAEVLLQDSTAGRTMLLGVLPTAALYTVVAFVSRLVRG